MSNNDNDTYTCARCGGVFAKCWTDEEAAAEYVRNFGSTPDPDDPVLCEPCYLEIMGWHAERN